MALCLTVPDTPANLTLLAKQGGNHGGTGYPAGPAAGPGRLRHPDLIDAVFGPTAKGETTYAACPAALASAADMIMLADRNFASGEADRRRSPAPGPSA